MGTTEAYSGFASVYDIFQDNVDYSGWHSWLVEKLRKDGIRDGLVCELGCGTGTMTELLSRSGYDMIGIDNSGEMLMRAMEKKQESGQDILYLMQDMTEFELYGTVRAIISVCDSLNYVTEEEDLLKVFRLVNNYLDPGGLFLFDMNTVYKYRELLGSRTFAENREEESFIWENDFDEETGLNEYALTLFLKTDEGLYEKVEEYHYQRAYTKEKVLSLLREAGLEVLAVYDAYTEKEPSRESERLCFAAREKGKASGSDPGKLYL